MHVALLVMSQQWCDAHATILQVVPSLMDLPADQPPKPRPAPAASPYIHVDGEGVMRVAQTRLPIDSIVLLFREGRDAESIQKSFPAATLEQVYGVIAYYLGNREAVDDYLRSQQAVWEYARAYAEQIPSPVMDRLREIQKDRQLMGESR